MIKEITIIISISYAAETYYDLKENELIEIERIQEGFLCNLIEAPFTVPTATT